MFDISRVSGVLSPEYFPNLSDPKKMYDGQLKTIGTLSLETESIKFVFDFSAIYANGVPFCSTYNDSWTAAATFSTAMKIVYGDKFSSEL